VVPGPGLGDRLEEYAEEFMTLQTFGGHKQSGIVRENSLDGLAEYTNWQSLTLNKVPDSV
jgi:acyl-CoA reductase-like NAD-dependent aldehyde dehydrogenase